MNMLPLETFRATFGLHPVHYWGLSGQLAPVTSACNTVTREHVWQNADAVGRQEIREAIETAEQRLREYLGYSVAPHYTSETIALPRTNASDGRWQTVQLSEGYVQAIGSETLTRLGAGSVVYSDTDGDDLNDTFDVTWTPVPEGVSTDELALYFTAEDRIDDDPVGERWRILPVRILTETDGDGVVTAHIRGKAWQLVEPYRLEQVSLAEIDPGDMNNFVGMMDVYRRYTSTPQATLTWESAPYPSCCTVDASGDPAAIGTATARVAIRNGLLGIVAPAQATYDEDAEVWNAVLYGGCRAPDSVTVHYLAGVPLEHGQMAAQWRAIVARLAAAELAKPICACEGANKALHTWQFDVSRTGGAGDESYGAVSPDDLSNPFGTRRGHIYAWRQVKNLRQLRGFLPG